MKQTSFDVTHINNPHTRECHNSINLSTYSIMSKNIFSLNCVTNKIMKTKSIKSYQYCHESLSIYTRYRISFLHSTINDNFSTMINKAFHNNLNNKMCHYIYRFKMFNFNDSVYVKFNSSSSSFTRSFDNYNISHNHT